MKKLKIVLKSIKLTTNGIFQPRNTSGTRSENPDGRNTENLFFKKLVAMNLFEENLFESRTV